MFKDPGYKQKLVATNSAALPKIGIDDGVALYINNKDAKIPVAPPAPGLVKLEGKSGQYSNLEIKEEKKEVKKEVKKTAKDAKPY